WWPGAHSRCDVRCAGVIGGARFPRGGRAARSWGRWRDVQCSRRRSSRCRFGVITNRDRGRQTLTIWSARRSEGTAGTRPRTRDWQILGGPAEPPSPVLPPALRRPRVRGRVADGDVTLGWWSGPVPEPGMEVTLSVTWVPNAVRLRGHEYRLGW